MEYIIVWVICGILAAEIAKSKGRSWTSWFVSGILFGPLSIIVILLLGRRDVCPYCRGTVHPLAILCPHCRSELLRSL